jgi:hypothetical protein
MPSWQKLLGPFIAWVRFCTLEICWRPLIAKRGCIFCQCYRSLYYCCEIKQLQQVFFYFIRQGDALGTWILPLMLSRQDILVSGQKRCYSLKLG